MGGFVIDIQEKSRSLSSLGSLFLGVIAIFRQGGRKTPPPYRSRVNVILKVGCKKNVTLETFGGIMMFESQEKSLVTVCQLLLTTVLQYHLGKESLLLRFSTSEQRDSSPTEHLFFQVGELNSLLSVALYCMVDIQSSKKQFKEKILLS